MNNTKLTIILFAIILRSSWAISQFTVVDYKDCESLSGISTNVDQISPSNPMFWDVGTGYSGNGYRLMGNSYGGHIEYLQTFLGNSYLEFNCKAVQMGYQNLIPNVTIDGNQIAATILNANVTGSYIKIKTSNIIFGSHVIRIKFGPLLTYYQYFIDEIYTYSDANSSIEEFTKNNKELVKIIDFMGRETEFKTNTPLIFIYSDGTRERVMKIEE